MQQQVKAGKQHMDSIMAISSAKCQKFTPSSTSTYGCRRHFLTIVIMCRAINERHQEALNQMLNNANQKIASDDPGYDSSNSILGGHPAEFDDLSLEQLVERSPKQVSVYDVLLEGCFNKIYRSTTINFSSLLLLSSSSRRSHHR